MTNLSDLPDHKNEAGPGGVDRRGLLKTAAALAATTMIAPQALARDFGRNAEPIPTPISS